VKGINAQRLKKGKKGFGEFREGNLVFFEIYFVLKVQIFWRTKGKKEK